MPAPDYSEYFNTELSPAMEQQFQNWAIRNQALKDLFDYDLRGAFKAGAMKSENGHLPDTYKKPNHPTFSAESMYSSPEMTGGEWLKGADGKWTFQASPFNVQMHGAPVLQDYFQRVEPDSTLVLPVVPRVAPPAGGVRG